jgi:Holliday junction resolvase RusA-like endonuclease
MKWDAVIPGQPVSLNDSIRMGTLAVQRKGQPVLRADGSPKVITRPVKTEQAKQYQQDAQLILQAAKPSKFKPTGQLRVVFDIELAHDMDSDNIVKPLCDALKRAIAYDDVHFLPCVRSKIAGQRRPFVLMTIEEA